MLNLPNTSEKWPFKAFTGCRGATIISDSPSRGCDINSKIQNNVRLPWPVGPAGAMEGPSPVVFVLLRPDTDHKSHRSRSVLQPCGQQGGGVSSNAAALWLCHRPVHVPAPRSAKSHICLSGVSGEEGTGRAAHFQPPAVSLLRLKEDDTGAPTPLHSHTFLFITEKQQILSLSQPGRIFSISKLNSFPPHQIRAGSKFNHGQSWPFPSSAGLPRCPSHDGRRVLGNVQTKMNLCCNVMRIAWAVIVIIARHKLKSRTCVTPAISRHYVGKHGLIADRHLLTPSVIEEVVELLKALRGGAQHLIRAFLCLLRWFDFT